MGDGIFVGVIIGFVFAGIMAVIVVTFHQSKEWECERAFNVYDCEYEWYPVFDEATPEDSELIP